MVLDWIANEAMVSLYTTTITEGELLLGVAMLPHGKHRQTLALLVTQILANDFTGRILPFDNAAAGEYADIAANRGKTGRPISEPDARIAAIARSRGAAIATRNIRDFADCGIDLIDPWA